LGTSLLVTAAGTVLSPVLVALSPLAGLGRALRNECKGQRFDFCTRQGLTPGYWCAITCALGPIIALSRDCYA
jgi:hypothetical protein